METGLRVTARPAIYDGTVYIGSQYHYLYALDADTGERIWRYDAGSHINAGAAVTEGAVFVADLDGSVHAVNRADGTRLWKIDDLGVAWRALATDGQRVFTPLVDGIVNALDVKDGSIVWSFKVDDNIYGGATVANGLVYFLSYDDFVYALNAETGEVAWAAELGIGSSSTPTVAGGLVLVGSLDDHVYALNSATGRHVWNFWTGDSVTRSITTFADAAYFGSNDGHVYSISLADGSLNWRYDVGEEIRSTPTIAGGIVYIGSNADELLALDASNGALVWKYGTGDDIHSHVAVHHNRVYFGSNDDKFYALAAGFPDGYAPVVAKSLIQPKFNPMPVRVMRGRMRELFSWRDRDMLMKVGVYGPDGSRETTGDQLVFEIFENGYHMLMGRTPQQDGWDARFLPVEDFEALAEERGNPELTDALGWCCIRTDDGLALIMRADVTLDSATATTAHEAGHALQRMLNPVQNKAPNDSLFDALLEAEAYTFEVALIRKLGEYMGVETARWPHGYRYDSYLNSWRKAFQDSITDLTQEHTRGRLIMWQAVLNDPELLHLKIELLLNGHVSADSLMDMYYRFVRLTPGEVEDYIESITVDPLENDLSLIFRTIKDRIIPTVEYEELVINVPVLVMSP